MREGDLTGAAEGPVDAGALAQELRLLARLSTPAAVKQAELPLLRRLAGDEVSAFVDAAIARVSEAKYRAAAEAVLGSGDGRWTSLERRGQEAAERFGLTTYDAFRRARKSTSTSHLDETLALVADTMVATADLPSERSRFRSARAGSVAVAVVLAVALVVVLAVELARSGGNATAGTGNEATSVNPSGLLGSQGRAASTRCPARIGDLATPIDADLSRYVAPFRRVAEAEAPGSCASSPIGRWQALVEQRLLKESADDGALLATDPAHVLRLTAAEYTSYHQFGGTSGDRAQAIAGVPVAQYTDHRVTILRTTNGGFVSEGRDQPGFYVGSTVWEQWSADGAAVSPYGLPTSNPLFDGDGYHQDFEQGTFHLPFSGSLRWEPVADPAGALPPDPAGHILRHDDGTAWYVDGRSVRHWIPDGGTYQCIRRGGATQLAGVPGYAIAALTLGVPASCGGGTGP